MHHYTDTPGFNVFLIYDTIIVSHGNRCGSQFTQTRSNVCYYITLYQVIIAYSYWGRICAITLLPSSVLLASILKTKLIVSSDPCGPLITGANNNESTCAFKDQRYQGRLIAMYLLSKLHAV